MKWTTRLKIMRITRIAMIFCLVFLVLFAGFSLYGSKVGNFVVRIEEQNVKISACITENTEKDATTRFSVPGIKGQDAATLSDLPERLSEGIGVKNDDKHKRYLAFSFYLLNRSERAVGYDMTGVIVDRVGRAIDVLRVLLIAGAKTTAGGEIFAKPEDEAGKAHLIANNITYETKDFISDEIVLKKTVEGFEVGGVVKYTVVLWLEGWDVACTDELFGDRLKMRMNIQAY